jgi:hypothetical protein
MNGRVTGLVVLFVVPAAAFGNDRFVEALRLGIDNIEIDLGWDEAGPRLIVGHDAAPRPGVAYPELEPYIENDCCPKV